MRALKISVAEKFCETFDLTWWKFSPVVTSTPIKLNLWSSVNSMEMDFECDITMIGAGEPMSVDSIQSNWKFNPNTSWYQLESILRMINSIIKQYQVTVYRCQSVLWQSNWNVNKNNNENLLTLINLMSMSISLFPKPLWLLVCKIFWIIIYRDTQVQGMIIDEVLVVNTWISGSNQNYRCPMKNEKKCVKVWIIYYWLLLSDCSE